MVYRTKLATKNFFQAIFFLISQDRGNHCIVNLCFVNFYSLKVIPS